MRMSIGATMSFRDCSLSLLLCSTESQVTLRDFDTEASLRRLLTLTMA